MAAQTPVGQEFWLVAKSSKDAQDPTDTLKASRAFTSVDKFVVPDGEQALSFGSFDNLIKLTDDLQKCDGQLDGIVHRLERQLLELDPKAQFKVKVKVAQGQGKYLEKSVAEYLSNWAWDDAKYPRSRSITETVTFLMTMVTKNDDTVRNKAAQLNEAKTAKSNLSKKEGANLLGKDLIDVLTPDIVKMGGGAADDFIQTEHLSTVVIILARGADVDFLKTYQTLDDKVVPLSAKKFEGLDDKDGNMVWRVVVFKSSVDTFKKACREKIRGATVRDFEYSEAAYKDLITKREQAGELTLRLNNTVRELYISAWSDTFCAWLHIKAMRIFVESVLRFGMPPAFKSFVLVPKSGGQAAARTLLADAMGGSGSVAAAAEAGEEGEEFFPYVSFSFTPFTAART